MNKHELAALRLKGEIELDLAGLTHTVSEFTELVQNRLNNLMYSSNELDDGELSTSKGHLVTLNFD